MTVAFRVSSTAEQGQHQGQLFEIEPILERASPRAVGKAAPVPLDVAWVHAD